MSCSLFQNEEEQIIVAQLGEHKVYRSEIMELLPVDYTVEDSTQIVEQHLEEWTKDHMLLNNAMDNISEERQRELDQLIERYRIELYVQEYLAEMVKQHMDTNISEAEIKKYYEQRREDLKLNEDLVQFQYIHLDPINKDLDQIDKWFREGDSISLKKVDSLNLNYRSYFLDDDIWIKKSTLFDRINAINPTNERTYIKEGAYWKLEDSLGVYLVHFKDVLKRGNRAPLSYVKPTIKQVLLNKSKIAYIQKLEKDLLNDAKSSNKVKADQ
ncbi:peptidylprolyl isomerase [Nonlabens xiamenensis]|uniref:peptidylprolyl isomerase n=1 Tax=Nonlabens xiamenensis TaxID=2341043 RepID=UPI001F0C5C58|nr:peptidylprolyl isomerase [Nonlabens xiamenensis]